MRSPGGPWLVLGDDSGRCSVTCGSEEAVEVIASCDAGQLTDHAAPHAGVLPGDLAAVAAAAADAAAEGPARPEPEESNPVPADEAAVEEEDAAALMAEAVAEGGAGVAAADEEPPEEGQRLSAAEKAVIVAAFNGAKGAGWLAQLRGEWSRATGEADLPPNALAVFEGIAKPGIALKSALVKALSEGLGAY